MQACDMISAFWKDARLWLRLGCHQW